MRSLADRLEEIDLSPEAGPVRYEDFLRLLRRDRQAEVKWHNWIRGTKVVDSGNRPMIVYHGSSEYRESPQAFSHFGTLSVAREFAGRIGGYFLRMMNPVTIKDPVWHNLAGYLQALHAAKILSRQEVISVLRLSAKVGGFSGVPDDDDSMLAFTDTVLNDGTWDRHGPEGKWLSQVMTWNPESFYSYRMLRSLLPVLDAKNIDGFRYVNRGEGSRRSISWIITRADQCAPISRFIKL